MLPFFPGRAAIPTTGAQTTEVVFPMTILGEAVPVEFLPPLQFLMAQDFFRDKKANSRLS